MKGRINKNINIEDNYFPNKQKSELLKCNLCGKPAKIGKPLKYYVIADDIENPRPFHSKCIEKLRLKIILNIGN